MNLLFLKIGALLDFNFLATFTKWKLKLIVSTSCDLYSIQWKVLIHRMHIQSPNSFIFYMGLDISQSVHIYLKMTKFHDFSSFYIKHKWIWLLELQSVDQDLLSNRSPEYEILLVNFNFHFIRVAQKFKLKRAPRRWPPEKLKIGDNTPLI